VDPPKENTTHVSPRKENNVPQKDDNPPKENSPRKEENPPTTENIPGEISSHVENIVNNPTTIENTPSKENNISPQKDDNPPKENSPQIEDNSKVSPRKDDPPKEKSPRTEESKNKSPRTEESKGKSPRTEETKEKSPRTENNPVENGLPKENSPRKVEDPPKENSPRKEDNSKVSPRKDDPPKEKSPRTEEPKGKSPRTEEPKGKSPRTEESKEKSPRTEDPKEKSPRTEESKNKSPRTEESKNKSPRTEETKEKSSSNDEKDSSRKKVRKRRTKKDDGTIQPDDQESNDKSPRKEDEELQQSLESLKSKLSRRKSLKHLDGGRIKETKEWNKESDKKKEIKKQFLKQEEIYITYLGIIIDHYYEPMKSSKLFNDGDINEIYSNISSIYQCSTTLVEKLKDDQALGLIFTDMGLFFKIYSPYYFQKDRRESYLKKIRKNPKENQFINNCKKKSSFDLTLDFLLDIPITHLMEYRNIFEEFIEACTEDDTDLTVIKNCVDVIDNVKEEVYSQKERLEQCQKILKISNFFFP